jgi:hypothetical protein
MGWVVSFIIPSRFKSEERATRTYWVEGLVVVKWDIPKSPTGKCNSGRLTCVTNGEIMAFDSTLGNLLEQNKAS